MDLSKLPIVEIDKVWHVGTMNLADKGSVYEESYEGAGLSVSVNPDTWEAIAKLGGAPWWNLSRSDGRPGRFIDLLAIKGRQRASLVRYAVAEGLLALQVRYQVSHFDPDTESTCQSLFDSKEEALAEKQDMRECEYEDVRLRKVTVPCATKKLVALVGQPVSDAGAFDIAVTVLTEGLADIDGVWWASELDEFALKAPAGVISLRALPNWTHKKAKRFASN